MLRPDHQRELIARDRQRIEARVVDRALDEADFDFSLQNRLGDLRRIADGKADIDQRIGAPEGDEMARQPIAGDGLARLNGERAPPQAGDFAQGALRRRGASQNGARLGEEQAAGLGQLDPASDAVE